MSLNETVSAAGMQVVRPRAVAVFEGRTAVLPDRTCSPPISVEDPGTCDYILISPKF